jgi:hypothetical protein
METTRRSVLTRSRPARAAKGRRPQTGGYETPTIAAIEIRRRRPIRQFSRRRISAFFILWLDRDESTRTALEAVFEAGRNRDGTVTRSVRVLAGQSHDDL